MAQGAVKQKETGTQALTKLVVGLAAIAAILYGAWTLVAGWRPSRTDFPIQGISMVPSAQAIQWDQVRKDGVDFAYIVATEGADIRHEGFAAAIAGAEEAGIETGAMHIFDLCRLAIDQADNFIRTVPRDSTQLPLAVKVGAILDNKCAVPSRSAVLSEIAMFLQRVEAHMGKPAILKIDFDFEKEFKISYAVDRPLWLERTFLRPDYANRGWALWQSSASHEVAGIAEPVQWSVAKPIKKRQ